MAFESPTLLPRISFFDIFPVFGTFINNKTGLQPVSQPVEHPHFGFKIACLHFGGIAEGMLNKLQLGREVSFSSEAI